MKPIIIIKERNKDGKFELTEQELKELIEQAYEQGVADGRPKATLPQTQYDNPVDGIYYRKFNLGNGPKDAYGNPISYCGGTTVTDPKDTRAVLTLTNESNDLVYRGGEHKVISPKQGEPIPCYDTPVTCGTSSQPNPATKLNNAASSTEV